VDFIFDNAFARRVFKHLLGGLACLGVDAAFRVSQQHFVAEYLFQGNEMIGAGVGGGVVPVDQRQIELPGGSA
jgi:hypothetical protein